MKKVIVLLAALVAVESKAGFLAEPYIGYETGGSKLTDGTGATVASASSTGMGYGARLGYRFVTAWVAADVNQSSGKAKDTLGSSPDTDFTQTGMGVSAGVDLPLGFRVFGGYGFSQELKLKYSDSTEQKFNGTYTKVGVGMRVVPKVNLNLEYKMNNYTKTTDNSGTETNLSDSGAKFESVPLYLTASFSF